MPDQLEINNRERLLIYGMSTIVLVLAVLVGAFYS